MDVRDLHGKTALVTGGASGIGRATALELARRGADLFVCDLDEAGLDRVAGEIQALGRKVLTRRVDVARREEMQAFADRVHGQVDAVDLLMNNAGVGLGAGFAETSLEDWDWILGINLKGVIHGLHFFVPKMIAAGRGGHVVNVSSAAGYMAAEPLTAYCTTKFAVLGLTESIHSELARHGIGATAICPGLINTPIVATSPMRGIWDSADAKQQGVDLYQRRNYTPERVATNILKAVQRGRMVAPISPEAWGMYWMKRFLPRTLARLGRWSSDRQRRRLEAAE
jgi:NAD(P)-dependent dehydrogenase (short-subunit alcohol dehydrogenase family)